MRNLHKTRRHGRDKSRTDFVNITRFEINRLLKEVLERKKPQGLSGRRHSRMQGRNPPTASWFKKQPNFGLFSDREKSGAIAPPLGIFLLPGYISLINYPLQFPAEIMKFYNLEPEDVFPKEKVIYLRVNKKKKKGRNDVWNMIGYGTEFRVSITGKERRTLFTNGVTRMKSIPSF